MNAFIRSIIALIALSASQISWYYCTPDNYLEWILLEYILISIVLSMYTMSGKKSKWMDRYYGWFCMSNFILVPLIIISPPHLWKGIIKLIWHQWESGLKAIIFGGLMIPLICGLFIMFFLFIPVMIAASYEKKDDENE